MAPRFTPRAREANLALFDLVSSIARSKAATSGQIALPWLLARAMWIAPVPGTRHLSRLAGNSGTVRLDPTSQEMACIATQGAAIPLTGARLPEAALTMTPVLCIGAHGRFARVATPDLSSHPGVLRVLFQRRARRIEGLWPDERVTSAEGDATDAFLTRSKGGDGGHLPAYSAIRVPRSGPGSVRARAVRWQAGRGATAPWSAHAAVIGRRGVPDL